MIVMKIEILSFFSHGPATMVAHGGGEMRYLYQLLFYTCNSGSEQFRVLLVVI